MAEKNYLEIRAELADELSSARKRNSEAEENKIDVLQATHEFSQSISQLPPFDAELYSLLYSQFRQLKKNLSPALFLGYIDVLEAKKFLKLEDAERMSDNQINLGLWYYGKILSQPDNIDHDPIFIRVSYKACLVEFIRREIEKLRIQMVKLKRKNIEQFNRMYAGSSKIFAERF